MMVVIIVDLMAMALVAVAAPIVAVGAPAAPDIVAVVVAIAAVGAPVAPDIVALAVAIVAVDATAAATVELRASSKAYPLPPHLPALPCRTLSRARPPFASVVL